MPSSVEFDEKMMKRALALARRALGETSPNPMVGAIVAKKRRVISEGYHHQAGGPHAEIHALKAAGDRAKGADLYVTLEPCNTHGRTPPCTDAIIEAGIKRVVVAARDPNPKHDGRGLDLLREAGIKVEAGLLAEEANRLNEGFNKWIRTGLPFVIAKAAMSLDGKIATVAGESKWITGEPARAHVQELRRAADAIMVGSRTVARDNPRLSIRIPGVKRQPWRVIVDSRGSTSLDAGVFSDEQRSRSIVLTSLRAPVLWRRQLAERGVTVIESAVASDLPVPQREADIPVCPAPDLKRQTGMSASRDHGRERLNLRDALKRLGERGITSVLVEGGGELLGAFFDARLVDKIVMFYAPKIIGGSGAPTAVAGQGARQLSQAIELRNVEWRRVGDDLVMMAYC